MQGWCHSYSLLVLPAHITTSTNPYNFKGTYVHTLHVLMAHVYVRTCTTLNETHQSEAVGCGQHCCIHGWCVIGYTDPTAFGFVFPACAEHWEEKKGELIGPGGEQEWRGGEEGWLKETQIRERERERVRIGMGLVWKKLEWGNAHHVDKQSTTVGGGTFALKEGTTHFTWLTTCQNPFHMNYVVSDPAQIQVWPRSSFMQKRLVILCCAHHEKVTRSCKQQRQCSVYYIGFVGTGQHAS